MLGRHERHEREREALLREAREQTRWLQPEAKRGYRDLIDHVGDFVRRLAEGRPPLVAPQEARAAVAASVAARASARGGGRPVSVGSVTTPWE
jgi:hypothetical protein